MTMPARSELTDLEQQTLELVAAGLTFPQIGRRVGTTKAAVRARMQRVMRKLGADSSPQAVYLACRVGLLDGRPQRHGDHAGYEAHRKRGEDPKQCKRGCPEGERAHRAAMRAAKEAA
jgi:DNA-binding CsgD family transcriptional regulator